MGCIHVSNNTKPRTNQINMKIKNALDTTALDNFISKADTRTIAKIRHEIGDILWYWLGDPTIERIEFIEFCNYYMKEFIDFEVVKSRVSNIEEFRAEKKNYNSTIGIHISKIFPELEEIKKKFDNILDELPNGIKKAELILYPIALEAGADASMEAAIYFAAQGERLLEPIDIKKEWHRVICLDIERGRPMGKVSEEILDRAKSRTLSLSEASEILRPDEYNSRFFGFRDEEEDFIDATFVRATEWFEVKGFEPWLNSLLNELSTAFQHGIEHNRLSWGLFFWCRSDLAINKAEKIGLESLLFGLLSGTIEKDKPWKIFWQVDRTHDYVYYLPIASSIIFCWNRIKPTSFSSNLIEKAIDLLFQTQLNSGGWPLLSKQSEGCILSTCFAIHALAIAKPSGYKSAIQNAKDWLIKEQDENGLWHIQGGPTIMLSVLVLESIHLASENFNISFNLNNTNDRLNEKSKMTENNITFDYSGESWFKAPIPKTSSVSYTEAKASHPPKIALITAVEIELQAVLKKLKPPKGKRMVRRVIDGTETYYIGRFGKFEAVVTMCSMGTIGASAATLAVDALIRNWNPIGIVMVGIAFGASLQKQKVGDVLVASNIIPYENQRVGEQIIYRSPIIPSSNELINRIRNILDWEFLRPDNTKVKKHIGQILSGEKLVDNIEFKNNLIEQYPQVIGGEMEGAGLWSAADKHKKSWILIKSVCDWGDGNKHDDYQPLAAASAVSLCEFIFNDEHTLDGMK